MPVELNVRSELNRIIGELTQIQEAAGKVGDGLADAGKKVGDGLEDQAKKTQTALEKLRSFGGRVADQLVRDFKALASINALAGSLKFSEMFRGSIKETVTLSDSIRKLGTTLGIARGEMSRFQDDVTKGMAKVGLSSTAAANAIAGLAESPVRGEKNILAYATTAGQLASVGRQQGQEGEVAKGLAAVVTARGGNPNDQAQMRAVGDDVLRIRNATGRSVTDILGSMQQLFSGANKSFQGRLQGGGAVSLASAAMIGGAGATAFLESYLKSNVFQRFGSNAQGLGGIVGKDGSLNLAQMEAALGTARGRGMGDEQAGLTTMGLSDDEAKGFIRLTEALRQNQDAVDGARKQQVDLNAAYRESMGLGEAFGANLNRVKGMVSGPLASGTQGLTDVLSSASQSGLGAAAVTGGAGILAALLAGGGLRGVGKGLGVAAATEAATGRQVQPVFVTNFPSGFGMGDGLGSLAKGAGIAGALGTVGLVAAGVAVGVGAVAAGAANESKLSDEALAPLKRAEAKDNEQKQILKDINASMQQLKVITTNGRIEVEVRSKSPDIKASRTPNRGGSFGPQ